jgi:hypothetical protein
LLRVAGTAASLTLGSTKHILDHFRSGEGDYGRWFKDKVRPLFRAVTGLDRPKRP